MLPLIKLKWSFEFLLWPELVTFWIIVFIYEKFLKSEIEKRETQRSHTCH
jgi:hypothetical protein